MWTPAWTEAALAYLHLACVLGWVVFLTSQTALLRPAWFNGAVVDRLVDVDRILWICWSMLLLSGLARATLGMKGAEWYWSQPLVHVKLTLLLLLGVAAWPNSSKFRAWQRRWEQDWKLPNDAEVQRVRRRVMWSAHLMLVIPLLGVALARGLWVR
jgi:putative membrane protein